MADPNPRRRWQFRRWRFSNLLRPVSRANDGAADQYTPPTCREKAEAVEPVLKAFEYLPGDVCTSAGTAVRHPRGNQGTSSRRADMPTHETARRFTKDFAFPTPMRGFVERLRNPRRKRFFGKTVSTEFAWRHPRADGQIHGIQSTRRAVRHRVPRRLLRQEVVPLAFGHPDTRLGSSGRLRSMASLASSPVFGAANPLAPACIRLALPLDHVGFFPSRAVSTMWPTHCRSLAAPVTAIIHGRPMPTFSGFPSNGDCRRWAAPAARHHAFCKMVRRPNANSNRRSRPRSRQLAAMPAQTWKNWNLPELDRSNWGRDQYHPRQRGPH